MTDPIIEQIASQLIDSTIMEASDEQIKKDIKNNIKQINKLISELGGGKNRELSIKNGILRPNKDLITWLNAKKKKLKRLKPEATEKFNDLIDLMNKTFQLIDETHLSFDQELKDWSNSFKGKSILGYHKVTDPTGREKTIITRFDPSDVDYEKYKEWVNKNRKELQQTLEKMKTDAKDLDRRLSKYHETFNDLRVLDIRPAASALDTLAKLVKELSATTDPKEHQSIVNTISSFTYENANTNRPELLFPKGLDNLDPDLRNKYSEKYPKEGADLMFLTKLVLSLRVQFADRLVDKANEQYDKTYPLDDPNKMGMDFVPNSDIPWFKTRLDFEQARYKRSASEQAKKDSDTTVSLIDKFNKSRESFDNNIYNITDALGKGSKNPEQVYELIKKSANSINDILSKACGTKFLIDDSEFVANFKSSGQPEELVSNYLQTVKEKFDEFHLKYQDYLLRKTATASEYHEEIDDIDDDELPSLIQATVEALDARNDNSAPQDFYDYDIDFAFKVNPDGEAELYDKFSDDFFRVKQDIRKPTEKDKKTYTVDGPVEFIKLSYGGLDANYTKVNVEALYGEVNYDGIIFVLNKDEESDEDQKEGEEKEENILFDRNLMELSYQVDLLASLKNSDKAEEFEKICEKGRKEYQRTSRNISYFNPFQKEYESSTNGDLLYSQKFDKFAHARVEDKSQKFGYISFTDKDGNLNPFLNSKMIGDLTLMLPPSLPLLQILESEPSPGAIIPIQINDDEKISVLVMDDINDIVESYHETKGIELKPQEDPSIDGLLTVTIPWFYEQPVKTITLQGTPISYKKEPADVNETVELKGISLPIPLASPDEVTIRIVVDRKSIPLIRGKHYDLDEESDFRKIYWHKYVSDGIKIKQITDDGEKIHFGVNLSGERTVSGETGKEEMLLWTTDGIEKVKNYEIIETDIVVPNPLSAHDELKCDFSAKHHYILKAESGVPITAAVRKMADLWANHQALKSNTKLQDKVKETLNGEVTYNVAGRSMSLIQFLNSQKSTSLSDLAIQVISKSSCSAMLGAKQCNQQANNTELPKVLQQTRKVDIDGTGLPEYILVEPAIANAEKIFTAPKLSKIVGLTDEEREKLIAKKGKIKDPNFHAIGGKNPLCDNCWLARYDIIPEEIIKAMFDDLEVIFNLSKRYLGTTDSSEYNAYRVTKRIDGEETTRQITYISSYDPRKANMAGSGVILNIEEVYVDDTNANLSTLTYEKKVKVESEGEEEETWDTIITTAYGEIVETGKNEDGQSIIIFRDDNGQELPVLIDSIIKIEDANYSNNRSMIIELCKSFYINYLSTESFWMDISDYIRNGTLSLNKKISVQRNIVRLHSSINKAFQALLNFGDSIPLIDMGIDNKREDTKRGGPTNLPWFAVQLLSIMGAVKGLYIWTQINKRKYKDRITGNEDEIYIDSMMKYASPDARQKELYIRALNDNFLTQNSNWNTSARGLLKMYNNRKEAKLNESIDTSLIVIDKVFGKDYYLNGLHGKIIKEFKNGDVIAEIDPNPYIEESRIKLFNGEFSRISSGPPIKETPKLIPPEKPQEIYHKMIDQTVKDEIAKNSLINKISEYMAEYPFWD